MSSHTLLKLLAQIKSGIIIFEPFRRTPQEIAEFQDTVERLQELKQLNLIRSLFTERRAFADGEHCILAMVQGGLTADGEQLLIEHQDHVSLQQATD